MFNTDSYYFRNPDIVAVGTAEHYLFIKVDGSVLELYTPHPAQWSRWRGALGVMQTLVAVMNHHRLRGRAC